MKKIAILAFSDKHGGGVYQYTQSIIDALKEDKERKYIVFCNTADKRFDESGLEVRKIDKKQGNAIRKFIYCLQFFFSIRKAFFFRKNELQIFNDIDLFISPAISAYPHFYLNKPFVFTLHDMQERYYPEFFSFYEKFIRWINNRTVAKSAEKIICESNHVKSDIIKFIGINEKKITVIQSPPPENFLNFKFDSIKFQEVRKKYNLPDYYLFYPAQFWFHKNHIKLIEAFELVIKENNDIFLVLTGAQQNNYSSLTRRINELNLESRVRYLGYIDYDDMPYIYSMSIMLIMPTLFESVSIPIYEAFALGVPVCCSNVVALPEQVGDAGLLFNPHDINDIKNKILMYLKNEWLRNSKIELGLKKSKNFNHEEYRKKAVECYKKYMMNSNYPSISIIIAVFNGTDTLQQCIDSVSQQTYLNKELIIIDGGSTDGTVELLTANDGHINYWISEPDKGIYNAWNKALAQAKGEWICFLGADDFFWDTAVLEKTVEQLIKVPPNIRVAYGQVMLLNKAGEAIYAIGKPWQQVKKSFLQFMSIPHQATFHHRGLFDQYGGFDESFRITGDYELLLRELKTEDAFFITDIIIAGMRQGGISNTPENIILTMREIRRSQQLHGQRFPNRVWLMAMKRAYIRVFLWHLLGEKMTRQFFDWGRRVMGLPSYWTKT